MIRGGWRRPVPSPSSHWSGAPPARKACLFRKMEYEEFGTTGVADSSALGMFYAYRRPRRGLAYLLNATHPPTYKRIERVASMERNF